MAGRVVVCGFSVSRDGFGAGLDQSEAEPIGVGGRALHEWVFATRAGRAMIGQSGGSEGELDDLAALRYRGRTEEARESGPTLKEYTTSPTSRASTAAPWARRGARPLTACPG